MKFILRDIISNAAIANSFGPLIEKIYPGIDTALTATGFAISLTEADYMFNQPYDAEAVSIAPWLPPYPLENEVWVERVHSASIVAPQINLGGDFLLVGSSILQKTKNSESIYDMYAFYAVANGINTDDGFLLNKLVSIGVSPLLVSVSAGENRLRTAYCRLLFPQRNAVSPQTLFERDMRSHVHAMTYLRNRTEHNPNAVRAAIDQLPSWLTGVKP